jgi:predicted nucleic acid-binding protein
VILYLDTSALVKLIVPEDGSPDTIAWFAAAELTATSVITYAEACSALGQNDRRRKSRTPRLGQWLTGLDQHWRDVMKVPVAERVAGELALTHGLRGMDALQLAAAVTLRGELRTRAAGRRVQEVVVAAFDRRLLDAAGREGFATLGGPQT